jgi:heme-degrading monooxygenase HmoA
MAVVVVNEVKEGSQDFYDKVTGQVMPDGKLPDGCQVHIAGPGEEGWRVITVWDSDEQFQAFRDEKLIPALKEAGGENFVAPSIEPQQVYKLITA